LICSSISQQLPEQPEQLKAVMVWIHGGSYKGGSGTAKVYGPDHILTEDVVLVTVNYRLGLLGRSAGLGHVKDSRLGDCLCTVHLNVVRALGEPKLRMFENMKLGGLRGRKQQENREHSIMRRFIICTPKKIF
jgi:hypothetical protein